MRKSLLAKIHIAKKELGFDDDMYRDFLNNTVGKTSSSKCTDRQLVKVVEELKNRGWKGGNQRRKFRKVENPLKRKIYAQWGELQKLGAVESKDKTALDAFVKKYTSIDSVNFLDDKNAVNVIEILKKWIERVQENR